MALTIKKINAMFRWLRGVSYRLKFKRNYKMNLLKDT